MTDVSGRTQRQQRKKRRFMLLYTVALLMAFSPSKAIGQILPIFFLLGMIVYVQVRPNTHIVKYGIVVGGIGLFGILYQLILPEFWWGGYLFSVVTFSSFLLLLYDFSTIVDRQLLYRIGVVTSVVITFESIYGILQFVGAATRSGIKPWTGDFVWGTLAPPLDTHYAGTSPIFVLLISTLLLVALATSPARLTRLRLASFIIVLTAWMTASLLHSVIYFTGAVVAALAMLFLFKPRRRYSFAFAKRHKGNLWIFAALLVLVVAGGAVYGQNYRAIQEVLAGALEISPDAPYLKMRVLYNTLFVIPQQVMSQPLLGLGPGQFSSRAALMLTGDYLTRASIPFFGTHTSTLTDQHIIPYLGRYTSSNHFPSSSWLTVYGETGIAGVLLVLFLLIQAIRRFTHIRSVYFTRMNLAALTLLFYITFMGIQTVYWEYTQGICFAILSLKLLYDYLGAERAYLRRNIYTAAPDTELHLEPGGENPLAAPTA